MHTSRKLLLAAALLAPLFSLSAQTLLSDFSSNAGFGSSAAFVGTGSAFSIAGGAANFTVSGPDESDFAVMRYTGAVGSYTSNWSVRIDVNMASPGTILTGPQEQFLNLGLMVTRSDATIGLSGGAPNFDAFLIESNLYRNNALNGGVGSRDIRTALLSVGDALDDTNRYAQVSPLGASTSTALQITYDAGTHVLTGWYDADGAANTYNFTAITTLTADAGTWGAPGDFSIYLMGNSGYDNEAGGMNGPAIASGLATMDNFYGAGLSAVPEPSTYAAMFGVAALGLAAWRRRQPQAS